MGFVSIVERDLSDRAKPFNYDGLVNLIRAKPLTWLAAMFPDGTVSDDGAVFFPGPLWGETDGDCAHWVELTGDNAALAMACEDGPYYTAFDLARCALGLCYADACDWLISLLGEPPPVEPERLRCPDDCTICFFSDWCGHYNALTETATNLTAESSPDDVDRLAARVALADLSELEAKRVIKAIADATGDGLRAVTTLVKRHRASISEAKRKHQAAAPSDTLSEDEFGCVSVCYGNGESAEITDTGLYHVKASLDPEKPPYRVRVTHQPISVYALTIPADSSAEHGVLLKYQDTEGRTHTRAIPAALVHQPGNQIVPLLASAGVKTDSENERYLTRYVSIAQPPHRMTAYSRTGWQQDSVFVVNGDKIIGGAGQAVFQPKDGNTTANTASRGTLDDWRQYVALPACKSPGWRYAIMVSLSGPLLNPLDQPTTLHHTTGLSSIGKTNALRGGASVWGLGKTDVPDSFIQTWNSTGNAVECMAAAHSDMCLFMDELHMADADSFRNVIYMLGNGKGKARSNREATLRQSRHWRLAACSTGEIGIEAKIIESGKIAQAGVGVRALDIHADEAFLPKLPLSDVAALTDGAGRYYGTAGPAFVQHLINTGMARPGTTAALQVKQMYEATLSTLTKGINDSRVIRAAKAFAVVQVAGEIAVQAGILPTEAEPAVTVAQAFKLWYTGQGGKMVDEFSSAIVRVLDYIAANRDVTIIDTRADDRAAKAARFARQDEDDEDGINLNNTSKPRQPIDRAYRERVGWYRDGEVWIMRTPLESITGMSADAFCDHLKGTGAWTPADGRNKQVKVPGQGNQRAFLFVEEKLRQMVEPKD